MRLAHWTRADRLRRAWAGLGLCWAIAVATVFIPVAHLLLVPGFTLAGPLVFLHRWRLESAIVRATGDCPDCGNSQQFTISGRPSPQMDTRCASCGRGLTLERS